MRSTIEGVPVAPDRVTPGPAAVARRLTEVGQRVAAAAGESGRSAKDVTVVAVSKMCGVDAVAVAAGAGQRHFGESRAQELRAKIDDPLLGRWPDISWHFMGRLQTNKAKYVVGACALVHSIDRWDAAQAVHDRCVLASVRQRVLIQVNVGDDPRKSGLQPAALRAFLDRASTLDHLRIEGLMTIPALAGDPRPTFTRLRELRDSVRDDYPTVTQLSMGMSRDYAPAIREGATIVRIGEAIFGPRST